MFHTFNNMNAISIMKTAFAHVDNTTRHKHRGPRNCISSSKGKEKKGKNREEKEKVQANSISACNEAESACKQHRK